jgi:hypothetical protein
MSGIDVMQNCAWWRAEILTEFLMGEPAEGPLERLTCRCKVNIKMGRVNGCGVD